MILIQHQKLLLLPQSHQYSSFHPSYHDPCLYQNELPLLDVEVANLIIHPGDILIADEDGITRIPIDIAEETLEKCAVVREKETNMMKETEIKKRFGVD